MTEPVTANKPRRLRQTVAERLLAMSPSKPVIGPSRPVMSSPKPLIAPSKTVVGSSKPVMAPSKTVYSCSKPVMSSRLAMSTSKPMMSSLKLMMSSSKPVMASSKPVMSSSKKAPPLTASSAGAFHLRSSVSAPPLTAAVASQRPSSRLMVIDGETYERMKAFICSYPGLAIDCQVDMLQRHFRHISAFTLQSIIYHVLSARGKSHFSFFKDNSSKYMKHYNRLASTGRDPDTILLQLASFNRMSPVMMATLILGEAYPREDDASLDKLIKEPSRIENQQLSACVRKCIEVDITDGPMAELHRTSIKEKNMLKLKRTAEAMRLLFYVNDDGIKPDFEMIVPFMYKNQYVYWMISESAFADLEHFARLLIRIQKFRKRLGSGMIIFWQGYHEDINDLRDFCEGIALVTEFPEASEIDLMTADRLDR